MHDERYGKSKIVVESTPTQESSTILQRLKYAVLGFFWGLIFAQVILFAFRMGSFVIYFWLYTELFIAYLIICTIVGAYFGERFIETLKVKCEDWWDLWNEFRL